MFPSIQNFWVEALWHCLVSYLCETRYWPPSVLCKYASWLLFPRWALCAAQTRHHVDTNVCLWVIYGHLALFGWLQGNRYATCPMTFTLRIFPFLTIGWPHWVNNILVFACSPSFQEWVSTHAHTFVLVHTFQDADTHEDTRTHTHAPQWVQKRWISPASEMQVLYTNNNFRTSDELFSRNVLTRRSSRQFFHKRPTDYVQRVQDERFVHTLMSASENRFQPTRTAVFQSAEEEKSGPAWLCPNWPDTQRVQCVLCSQQQIKKIYLFQVIFGVLTRIAKFNQLLLQQTESSLTEMLSFKARVFVSMANGWFSFRICGERPPCWKQLIIGCLQREKCFPHLWQGFVSTYTYVVEKFFGDLFALPPPCVVVSPKLLPAASVLSANVA